MGEETDPPATSDNADSLGSSAGTIKATGILQDPMETVSEGMNEEAEDSLSYPITVIQTEFRARGCAIRAVEPVEFLENRMVFYTDASFFIKRGLQGAGAAVTYRCFPEGPKDVTWRDESYGIIAAPNVAQDVHTGDMFAISRALKIAADKTPGYSQHPTWTTRPNRFGIYIFTGSQRSLRTIRSYLAGDCSPADLLNNQASAEIPGLLEYLSICDALIEFHWVPGHSGIIRNDRADRLARDAARVAQQLAPHNPGSFEGRAFEVIPFGKMVSLSLD
ncbi:hypothetical protein DL766_001001 [Monosporascus sp. MC13-8B]|uniref:RNase H type-1 domain-containing protein n=1 Tax=Monosporascus cannonballus TaxID=155416 RepID=A0ABY0H3K8_9PEZI|nr:hypothetical protein DL762_005916 [Monosporascus cannonballus]RYO92678.1 hypothetical protein DL763_004591 [Monosporascus cannonballus]RYP38423.1 hypothetical protein DL766_001001 [Monosporascus sp. MC13-8B]